MSTTRKIKRGEIYYIYSFPTVGHEQRAGRPAVIVSNDENNTHSGTYEICYMTLQDKAKLPTHVFVDFGPCINSTILCEQVTTVSEERIGDFLCRIPEHLEAELDKAIAISLALTKIGNCDDCTENVSSEQPIPEEVMAELASLKHSNCAMNEELVVVKDANATLRGNLVEAKARADMYERMYNDLLDKLINRS